VIIAVVYTDDLAVRPLLLALVPLALFTVLVQRRVRSWWLLLPLAVLTWVLVHEAGVHATVAGVLLGFTVPVRRRAEGQGLAEHFEHRWRPLSAGVAVPVFAFFAAGYRSPTRAARRRTGPTGDHRRRRRSGAGQGRRRVRGDGVGGAVHPRPTRRRPWLWDVLGIALLSASGSPSRC